MGRKRGIAMRIWAGLRIYEAERHFGYTKSLDQKLVVTDRTRAELDRRLEHSVWERVETLTADDLDQLIRLAREGGHVHDNEEARKTVRDLGLSDEASLSMAVNVLVLLSQFKHGESLAEVSKVSLIPIQYSKGPAWGLINYRSNVIDIRVRHNDQDPLRQGFDELMTAIQVKPAQSRYWGYPKTEYVVESSEEVVQSNRDGSPVAQGYVKLIRWPGLLGIPFSKPLVQLFLALLVLSLAASIVMEFLLVQDSALANPGVFSWLHGFVDRISTTVLWALAITFVAEFFIIDSRHRAAFGKPRATVSWARS